MARVDGHGPKPQVQFINEWSKLKRAVAFFNGDGVGITPYDLVDDLVDYSGIRLTPGVQEAIADLLDQVPRLMDAYAELWELMETMLKAQEQLQASKNDFYVPDAQELLQGLANPERTQK